MLAEALTITLWNPTKKFAKSAIRQASQAAFKLQVRSFQSHASTRCNGSPKRILILNPAHIGDVVISTSIIPVLRSAYPRAELGFAVGSWSLMVVKAHPDVSFTHIVDHWMYNRSKEGFFAKLRTYRKTRGIALCDIRRAKYDIALSLTPFWGDLLKLAWKAGIPNRLGFCGSPYAPFATNLTKYPDTPFMQMGARQLEVLRPLSVDEFHLKKRKSVLAESNDDARKELCELLRVERLQDITYRIIHMGAGALNKEAPLDFWRKIAEEVSLKRTLVFTGKGKREGEQIERVTAGLSNCINACDQISWQGFVAAVRGCELLYGVDSMAGHVAAAVGTRCAVVYSGIDGVARWRPEGDKCLVFTNHLLCAPCGNIRGCKDMTCIREVRPEDLVNLG